MSIELITLSCNLKSNSRPNTITFCPKTCPVREHSWRRWTRMATFARPAIMEPLWYLNRETLGDARGKANFPSIGRKTIPRTDEKIHFIARLCTICAAHARRSHFCLAILSPGVQRFVNIRGGRWNPRYVEFRRPDDNWLVNLWSNGRLARAGRAVNLVSCLQFALILRNLVDSVGNWSLVIENGLVCKFARRSSPR